MIAGKYLKSLRTKEKKTLKEVAGDGVSESQLYKLESGQFINPTLKYVYRVAHLYNANLKKLYECFLSDIINEEVGIEE